MIFSTNSMFSKINVRTDRGRPLPFERFIVSVELIFSSSRSTLILA